MATKKKTDETENQVETATAESEAGGATAMKADAAKEAPKAVPAAASAEKTVAGTGDGDARVSRGKRAEKIGVVTSDKMMMTVVVRVDRLVKHPIYRKYVRKRKKFMAHDEKGAKIGDKVRIVETRPMSARKRWRVVEIIQKAEL